MISSEASLGASAPPYFSQPQGEPEYMNSGPFAPSSYSYQQSMMCSMQTQANCFGNFQFGLPPQMPPQYQPQSMPTQVLPVPFDDRRMLAPSTISQPLPMQSPMIPNIPLPKLSMCTIPAEHQDFICINPYHYERVVSNGLAPPDLKSLRVDPPPASLINKVDFPIQDYDISDAVSNSSPPFIEWAPSCALSHQESYP
ncbi:unnamed protein product, partial [Nippostrongylus brasiliensis]|uniref:MH2 domain-containing protein n=1 Tax=Nippostrongylus brasiliensis TaxID=27835 RepID=A0A0N4YVF2_NIPBR